MFNSDLVSIIVPVYGVEAYLSMCVDSLLAQTYENIEIILVDDESPDHCPQICDAYSQKDSRVRVFHKKNGGAASARNVGLNISNGDYICFVDSDDYVEKDMFEKMYNKAITKNFDVVVCDVNCKTDSDEQHISSLVEKDLTDSADIKKQMINIYPVAWNKIYKKNLFNNGVKFKTKIWYEDVDFLYKLFPYITSIGVVKESLINYVQRKGAISKTFDKRLYHYIDNWNEIVDFYKSKGFYNQYFEELEYCYVRYLYATFIKGATHFSKEEFNLAVKEAKKNVQEHFPNYKHNKYLKKSFKNIYLKHFNNLIANIVFMLYKRR